MRTRQIGETKFALDEHGHDVLSYSASDVQSFDPVSIEFALCRIAMVEVDLGAERRWALDSDSQFLVEKALHGLGSGLDVDDAMSAAVAQREASAERRASSEHQQPPNKAPRVMLMLVPMSKVLVNGGRHEGAKGILMAQHGAWWRVKPSEDTARDGTARAIVSVLRRDLELDSG